MVLIASEEQNIGEKLRIFIALELPSSVKNGLQVEIDRLRVICPARAVRWVRSDGIHLTLKFLGNISPDQLDLVKQATERAAQNSPAVNLRTGDLGCFPNLRRPKVIWMGITGDLDPLAALRNCVEEEIAPLGFPTEKRPFSPHLTLGRVKTSDRNVQASVGEQIKETRVQGKSSWTNTVVSVMQSTLMPTGAIYTGLAHFPLVIESSS